MARAKKKSDEFGCPHCLKKFHVAVRWCPKCESHMTRMGWYNASDICDRCSSGANSEYLSKKRGRDARIAAALAGIAAAFGPLETGRPWLGAKDFKIWCASPDYRKRLSGPIPREIGPGEIRSDEPF